MAIPGAKMSAKTATLQRQFLVVLVAIYFYRNGLPESDSNAAVSTPAPTHASSSTGHCAISCTQSGCTFSWPRGTGVPTALLQRAADMTVQEQKLACSLLELGQAHVFEAWEQAPDFDLMAQLTMLDNNYPGGLKAYLSRAKTLLSQAASGANALEGYTPSIPEGHDLEVGGATFLERERRGVAEGKRIAYVLVAGGLGERLGYSGIKLELPSDSLTRKPFLQLYIEHILALDAAAAASGADGPGAELVLMVSGDTDEPTRELLRANNHFGMPSDRITIVRQEKVPSLADNEAHLALKKDGRGVQTKPHGHGDVHTLLHKTNVVERWVTNGIKWVVFFQDTNALMFRSLPAVIGTSAAHGISMNSVCVARKAAEAVGAIMTLDKPGAERVTVNVEYNQIAALLKDAGQGGDANDARTGFSPYPGSINQIVVEAQAYSRLLRRTQGVVPEFVNPKYKKGTGRTLFKKPTRLESMMQDIAWQFGSSDIVSFTRFTGSVIFSPVKNSIDGAVDKVKAGVPPHSASSGENAVFKFNCDAMHEMGATVAPPVEANFGGVPLRAYPKVVFSPAFAPTIDALRSRFPSPSRVSIGQHASLVVEGGNGVTIEELNLQGILRIDATANGARVVVRFRNGPLSNGVWSFEPLGDDEQEQARLLSEESLSGKALDLRLEQLKMKAYRVEKREIDTRFIDVKVPAGNWVLSEEGLTAAAQ